MADLKISQLGLATGGVRADDYLPIERGAAAPNYRVSSAQIAALAQNAISLRDPKYGVVGNGSADDTTAIQAWIVDVRASTHKRGYAPAGTYVFTDTGVIANGSAGKAGIINLSQADNGEAGADVELFGDGMGITTFKHLAGGGAGGGTMTNSLYFLYTHKRNRLHDFTVSFDPTAVWTGSAGYRMYGIFLAGTGTDCRVWNIEVLNVSSDSGANDGGHAFHLEGIWNWVEYTTTLGTAVAAPGDVACTPSGGTGMVGIYIGRRLFIADGNAESVVVKAITQNTFTATFANTHLSSATVNMYLLGRGAHHVHDCFVHDEVRGCAFLVGSTHNTLYRNRINDVDNVSTLHGFYVTGGYNFFIANQIRGVYGYGLTVHIANDAAHIDGSGNRIEANLFENCAAGFLQFDGANSDGTNPDLPSPTPLNRHATVVGNTFRYTKDAIGGFSYSTQSCNVTWTGNTFEDAGGSAGGATITDGNVWVKVGDTSTGGSFVGNTLVQTWTTKLSAGFVQLGLNAVATGNVFQGNDNGSGAGGSAIQLLADYAVVSGNIFNGTFNHGVDLNGKKATVVGNNFNISLNSSSTNSAAIYQPDGGTEVASNYFNVGTPYYAMRFAGTETCDFHDNTLVGSTMVRHDSGGNTLRIYNNDGQISYKGNSALTLDRLAGAAMTFPKSTNTLAAGKLVKIASGALLTILTSDTTWLGVASSDTDASAANAYIFGRVGTEISVLCSNAHTAGNIAIASTATAGAVMDNTTTIPAAPASYGIFLDTSASTGVLARVLVMRNSMGGTT